MKAVQGWCLMTLLVIFSLTRTGASMPSFRGIVGQLKDCYESVSWWSVKLPKNQVAVKGNVVWVKLPDSEITLLSLNIVDDVWTIRNDSDLPVGFTIHKHLRGDILFLKGVAPPRPPPPKKQSPSSLLTNSPESDVAQQQREQAPVITTKIPGSEALWVSVTSWK
ncbi:hypothetical protein PSTG_01438 [Puccinia striiformis f. sp. tritici PST-78]|uniref:Uncharacterized protein n=2 Tax=Puccinia striiformis f. sp. tritici PST-78 TaxID=1165861 RepID=A0A0L0W2Y1_9BASI|nr:hypothetical protein PSTG_01438 [Puccinia striiformis f. sp. tritici PST-78]